MQTAAPRAWRFGLVVVPCLAWAVVGSAQEAIQLTLINSTGAPVTVLWVNDSGVEEEYGLIQPASRLTQTTYAGHTWNFRSAERLLGTHQVTESSPRQLDLSTFLRDAADDLPAKWKSSQSASQFERQQDGSWLLNMETETKSLVEVERKPNLVTLSFDQGEQFYHLDAQTWYIWHPIENQWMVVEPGGFLTSTGALNTGADSRVGPTMRPLQPVEATVAATPNPTTTAGPNAPPATATVNSSSTNPVSSPTTSVVEQPQWSSSQHPDLPGQMHVVFKQTVDGKWQRYDATDKPIGTALTGTKSNGSWRLSNGFTLTKDRCLASISAGGNHQCQYTIGIGGWVKDGVVPEVVPVSELMQDQWVSGSITLNKDPLLDLWTIDQSADVYLGNLDKEHNGVLLCLTADERIVFTGESASWLEVDAAGKRKAKEFEGKWSQNRPHPSVVSSQIWVMGDSHEYANRVHSQGALSSPTARYDYGRRWNVYQAFENEPYASYAGALFRDFGVIFEDVERPTVWVLSGHGTGLAATGKQQIINFDANGQRLVEELVGRWRAPDRP